MMHRFLLPTLYLFGFLLSFVTCAIKTEAEYLTMFQSLPESFYKDRLVFFTGVEARSAIVNFQRGWEAKLTQEGLDTRPKEVLVLRDVLRQLNEPIPDTNDPDYNTFWGHTSRALATVASGTIYVLVPNDKAKWGTFYATVEKDLLIANTKVQNVLELEFDGPDMGKVKTVVKGKKEFDSIKLLTAQEYEAFLGPAAKVNLNEQTATLTPAMEAKRAALFARLNRGGSGTGSGGV